MIHGKSMNENLIGPCGACGYEMTDREVKRCPACNKLVCKDCITDCTMCHADGCKACIEEKAGLFFCEPDCKKDYILNFALMVKHGSCNIKYLIGLIEDLL